MKIIKSGKLNVRYSRYEAEHPPCAHISLKNYGQQDGHSCGFVAALTVARYFKPRISARDVLCAVRPTVSWGANRPKMLRGLARLGILADHRVDLTIHDLIDCVEQGIPVIVSVWPEDWYSDHWTIVQAIDQSLGTVYLTNHDVLTLDEFRAEWSFMDMLNGRGSNGEGIACIGMPGYPFPLPPECL